MGLEPTRVPERQRGDVGPGAGPRLPPPPPPPVQGQRRQADGRRQLIYKRVIFDEFHRLHTVEKKKIIWPGVQEFSQWKELHREYVITGRLSEETVKDMWDGLEVVENPTPLQKEISIVCNRVEVTMYTEP